MTSLAIVVAFSKNKVIGDKNNLPWRLSSDLQHFKEITIGHTVIMGRKTFESIVSRLGKPLPGRKSIVMTRDETFSYPGVVVAHTPQEAISQVEDVAFVIGGEQIYAQMLPMVSRMYITEVDVSLEGDAIFPAFDKNQWREVSRETHEQDEHNQYNYSFVVLDKK